MSSGHENHGQGLVLKYIPEVVQKADGVGAQNGWTAKVRRDDSQPTSHIPDRRGWWLCPGVVLDVARGMPAMPTAAVIVVAMVVLCVCVSRSGSRAASFPLFSSPEPG